MKQGIKLAIIAVLLVLAGHNRGTEPSHGGRVESAWPVHGSVFVREGSVCFVAGRSSFLDGGMRLFSLGPATG